MKKRCEHCEKKANKLFEVQDRAGLLCKECLDSVAMPCSICGDNVHIDYICSTGGGEAYCPDCFTEDHDYCTNCGCAEKSDDIFNNDCGDPYCELCYYDVYTICEDCGSELFIDESYTSDGECICENCYDECGSVDFNSYRTYRGCNVPTPEPNGLKKNRFDRACGIELETVFCGDGSAQDIADECNANFSHTSDGSISGEGVEFISKPMIGDQLFEEVDKITDWLHNNSFSVNRSCGYHLHIDARDLYWPELTGIMLLGNACEDIMYSMMPASRSKSNWCRKTPIPSKRLFIIQSNRDFIDSWYNGSDSRQNNDKYNDSRYHGINMHSRVYLGTIEFRHHSGTTNPEKIKNWITICQSLVEKGAKLGKHLEDGTESKLLEFLKKNSKLTLPEFIEILELESIDNYILRRINKFSGLEVNTEEREVNNYITI
jgi:hypothetical protein